MKSSHTNLRSISISSTNPPTTTRTRSSQTLLEVTISQLLDHADELSKLDARLFLSQSDLKRLLGVSDDQASKLFRGPLWSCTVPVGEVHRRIYLPALLNWMEEHLGATLCGEDLR